MSQSAGVNEATGSILVVDDNAVNRATLTMGLGRDGHRVTTAENGREALELLASAPYDAVLLDIIMPELDGYAVLERMKSDERLRRIPVIVITAVDDLASAVRCIEIGADDYLTKPF
ncbi:MAG TPA: response regulator, partial [Candidatus Limnocylindria bacterium]|nr:response regulator [Candidatus Limnocylindria bacterium]